MLLFFVSNKARVHNSWSWRILSDKSQHRICDLTRPDCNNAGSVAFQGSIGDTDDLGFNGISCSIVHFDNRFDAHGRMYQWYKTVDFPSPRKTSQRL